MPRIVTIDDYIKNDNNKKIDTDKQIYTEIKKYIDYHILKLKIDQLKRENEFMKLLINSQKK